VKMLDGTLPAQGRFSDHHMTMSNPAFAYVYEKRKGHVRLLVNSFGSKEVWVSMKDLIDCGARYFTWKEYYLQYPDGDAGWGRGYSLDPFTNPLKTEPDNNSATVVLPRGAAVSLTGKTKGAWAEVVLEDILHIFGEIYYQTDQKFGEYRGWVRMTDDDGYPLLKEIVLGC